MQGEPPPTLIDGRNERSETRHLVNVTPCLPIGDVARRPDRDSERTCDLSDRRPCLPGATNLPHRLVVETRHWVCCSATIGHQPGTDCNSAEVCKPDAGRQGAKRRDAPTAGQRTAALLKHEPLHIDRRARAMP